MMTRHKLISEIIFIIMAVIKFSEIKLTNHIFQRQKTLSGDTQCTLRICICVRRKLQVSRVLMFV